MTNQETVRSTSISTNTSTNTCIRMLENASIVRTLFDLFAFPPVYYATQYAVTKLNKSLPAKQSPRQGMILR